LEASIGASAAIRFSDSSTEVEIYRRLLRFEVRALQRYAMIVKIEIADPDLRDRAMRALYDLYSHLGGVPSGPTDEALRETTRGLVRNRD